MPRVDDVAYLVKMIGNKYYVQARELVEKMAEQERQNGREQSARKLEVSLINWTNAKLVELPSSVKNLIWSEEASFDLEDLYLSEDIMTEVQLFIKERKNSEKLKDAGLTARSRILLAGPPGNGKTSLAEALARQLDMPFLSVKLNEIIGSHMGDTSSRLGKIFEYAQFNNCLVLLDELDCLGSKRSMGGEGADKERNSIVNTLLTNLDHIPDGSIIVGGTNFPEAIDGALERRFNLKLWLGNPSDDQIKLYVVSYQLKHGVNLKEFSGLSGNPWSRISEFCINGHRNIILGEARSNADDWVGKEETT